MGGLPGGSKAISATASIPRKGTDKDVHFAN
jgi:hypothetical protein